MRRKSAVVIAPITGEGKIVLIRQERIPIRETIWEMPAGQVDEVCESGSFKEVAIRELREKEEKSSQFRGVTIDGRGHYRFGQKS